VDLPAPFSPTTHVDVHVVVGHDTWEALADATQADRDPPDVVGAAVLHFCGDETRSPRWA
jgi:hypothetical protein